MTDDLVKRLRNEALEMHGMAWRNTSGGQETTMSATLADDAADRIEALTAERDRLREALSMIAVMGFSSSPEVSSNIGRMAVEQARAALKGESRE